MGIRSDKIAWNRIFAEGIAIVVSILLAFSIQAWWESHQQRQEQQALLSQLLERLRERQTFREGWDKELIAMIEACRRLLEIARNDDDSASDEEIDFLLNDVTWVGGSLNVGVAALESLYQSGNISRIDDKEITQQLANLRFAFAIEDGYTKREITFLDTRFFPFLDAHASIAQIYGADDGPPGLSEAENEQWSQYPVGSEVITKSKISHRALLRNREFQNLLIQRTLVLNNLLGWNESAYDVDESLRESIELVESKLLQGAER